MSTDKTAMNKKSMDRMRKILNQRIIESGFSAREVSRRAGMNQGYLNDFISGRSGAPEISRLMKVAEILGLPFSDLVGDDGSDHYDQRMAPATIRQGIADQNALVPLFAAEGLVAGKVWVGVSQQPVGFVPPLPGIANMTGMYAVTVANDVNAPRYFTGETVYVTPIQPARVGDFVFVRKKTGEAAIGRVKSIDSRTAVLSFVGARKGQDSATVAISEIESLHRIAGSIT